MNVLIIEDSKSTQMLLSKYVQNLGHHAKHVANAKEAIETLKVEPFDMILTDVEMPGQNGFDLTRELRASVLKEWIPIIFISGNTSDEYLTQGINAGGDAFLHKPINYTVLKAQIHAMSRIADMRKELARVNLELQALSVIDPLTNVMNRRGFDFLFEREWRQSQRTKNPMSVIMIDVDHFKKYNDHYGHPAGDQCLILVATTLKKVLKRPIDTVARYGGEEFIALLPGTNLQGAMLVAQSFVNQLEQAHLPHELSPVKPYVTMSCGVFCNEGRFDTPKEKLIEFADKGLYYAKEHGRNQAHAYTPETDTTSTDSASTHLK